VFVPRLDDAHVVDAVALEEAEGQKQEKEWVRAAEAQKNHNIVCCSSQRLPFKRRIIAPRRWPKCDLGPSDDVLLRWWGRSCVCGDGKPPERQNTATAADFVCRGCWFCMNSSTGTQLMRI
jgi:hypothetical protein